MVTRLLRADLHSHTYYSRDALTSPGKFVEACLRRGINCVAITEHNNIDGALAMQKACPFPVIVGEEIRTTGGDVIGLFLEEAIPPGLSPEETAARIKAQGGLVSAPHPFDRFRLGLGRQGLLGILPQLDLIETFNARNILPGDNKKALHFAQEHGLIGIAVSDAHSPGELGRTYVEIPLFEGPQSFRESLLQARLVERLSNPLVHLASRWAVIRRTVFGWRPVK